MLRNKIFVTGATGFIGSHTVRRLIKEDYPVAIYARKTSSLKFLPQEKIEIHYGDIGDLKELKEAVKNSEVIVHNAALVCDWAMPADFYKTNVQGTENILQAARDNDIKRIILISTCAVLGEEDSSLAKDENSPYKPRENYFLSKVFESDMNHYRVSKTIAEENAIEFCRQNKINLTVIRPTWVYGPREFNAGPFCFCESVLMKGLPFAPIGKSNLFHVIYVQDLARSVILSIEKNLKGINIFNIGNKAPVSINEYLGLFAKMLGKKMPHSMPEIFFQPIGFTQELLYKLLNIKKAPLLTRARVKMFYCNNIYDVSKAKRELGFTASTPLEIGIKKTVRWYRQNGFLKD